MKAKKYAREEYNKILRSSVEPIFPFENSENEMNIFQKQNYNDPVNGTIPEVNEEEDNTVDYLVNPYASPSPKKFGALPSFKNSNQKDNGSMEESKEDISPHSVKNNLVSSLK